MSFQMRMMRSRASREPNETISFRRNWTLVIEKEDQRAEEHHELADRRRDGENDDADNLGRIGFHRDSLPARAAGHDRGLDVVQDRERVIEHPQLLLNGRADLRRARDPFAYRLSKERDQRSDNRDQRDNESDGRHGDRDAEAARRIR